MFGISTRNIYSFGIGVFLIICSFCNYGLFTCVQRETYTQLTSMEEDSTLLHRARIILKNCVYGQRQHLKHLIDTGYCLDHCSLLDQCVAVIRDEYYCTFCYRSDLTDNFEHMHNNESIFLRDSTLSKLFCWR